MFHQNETIMKTASVQHIGSLVNNRAHASYQIDFSPLTNIYTYTMKKLTNISPFLLLLVPVFMMMAITIANNVSTTQDNEAALKATANTAVAKIPNQLMK